MLTFLCMIVIAADSAYPATEGGFNTLSQLTFVSNATREGKVSNLVVLEPDGAGLPDEHLHLIPSDYSKRCGPVTWGLMGAATYLATIHESHGPQGVCVTMPLADRLIMHRTARDEGREDHEARTRAEAYGMERCRRLDPIDEIIFDQMMELGRPSKQIPLFYDLAYTAENHVTLIVVREGTLTWWTYNKPEETDWIERGSIETDLDGAFRIVQGGGDLYLVDPACRVLSSPDKGLRTVGFITGWRAPGRDESLVLLEDQNTDKVGAVMVTAAGATVLAFEGDDAAAEDFFTTIESDELKDGLGRMHAILQEENDEGGD